jgi:predicted N-formylglutamate amidohydrolase
MASDGPLSYRMGAGLLGPSDPPAVTVINPAGRSPFLLIGDHAGNAIPATLRDLGVGGADQVRHIAWDIGIAALGAALAARLDAVFVRQTYSRLVIDCNRDPYSADACPAASDGTIVPGNRDLDPDSRLARIADIHRPYQHAIAAEIARRREGGLETILISLHSFTPVMNGIGRPWEIGVLHDGANDAFALALLDRLRSHAGLVAADNEPYRMDATDYTVPRHAFAAAIPYAELEIRQDLLAEDVQVGSWVDLLAGALAEAKGQILSLNADCRSDG